MEPEAGRGQERAAGIGIAAWPRGLSLQAGAAIEMARRAFGAAFQAEIDRRRVFLWAPVAAGLGAITELQAAREPVSWYAPGLAALFALLALLARHHAWRAWPLTGLMLFFLGVSAVELREYSVGAPVIDHIRIVTMTGYVTRSDARPTGARLVVDVASADPLPRAHRPKLVRVTMRAGPRPKAGDFIAFKARLLPPSQAAMPGGYDFASDAWFAGLGAVGSVLGHIEVFDPPFPATLPQRFAMALDRLRNRVADNILAAVPGERGAVAVAMVTGKRGMLGEGLRQLISKAGIFHLVTISGIQMSLVAGLLFWLLRRLLGLSATLALHWPIRKWAAGLAMAGAIAYALFTGARVGTERALIMTLIMFGAVLLDREALTMRNLALAALGVILLQPEALTGAGFQLSFAAVAALVAVHEARHRPHEPAPGLQHGARRRPRPKPAPQGAPYRAGRWVLALMIATSCATLASAPFMAADFNEIGLYVLVGNPLTLALIELVAVPGALLGLALYPLGWDGPVWHYVGLNIALVLKMARLIAAAPHSTLMVAAFPGWALAALTFGLLALIIWQGRLMRLTALPFLILGLAGAASPARPDMLIAPDGSALMVRPAQGPMVLLAKRRNEFLITQWLRALGDSRDPATLAIAANPQAGCDDRGCAITLAGGHAAALVLRPSAFGEDCRRADVIVTPLYAPRSCRAKVFDRASLATSGAVSLSFEKGAIAITRAEPAGAARPWFPQKHIYEFAARPKAGATPQ
ncbi:MAG: ComEC/Rec2 family competence protein [Hyphomicrobiales bacterium]|nr:ComEC/Rec2 family competence protein [Hyphomicrobiales bacterium]